MEKKIAIIGSGVSGIACSIILAKQGFNVDVFEKNSSPGGKIAEIKHENYRFDTGPSLFTLPELVVKLLSGSWVKKEITFSYKKLENICRYFYEDGTVINSFADIKKFAREANRITGEKEENITKYLLKAKELYDLTADVFLFSSFQRVRNFTTDAYKKTALNLYKLDAFKTLHERNKKSFSSTKLVQLFDRYSTYNGSNPYSVPATLKVISHLEHNLGAYFPDKGMYSIIENLVKAALEQNVKFHFNTPVISIHTEKNKVRGIATKNNGFIPYDIVVSSGDVFFTYKNLLKGFKVPWNIRRSEPSSSALIFYWGVNKKYKELDLHNILFSEDYRTEFQYIFKRKTIYHDPTVYIFISSKMVKDDAPTNRGNWFVMVNAPYNAGQDWDKLIPRARRHVINKINRILKTDIEKSIEFEYVNDPVHIEEETSSNKGALYGISSNSKFSAFLRHANFSRKIKGLYFTGGSVHPGGGIPLCISSAKIAAHEIINRYK